MVSTSLFSIIHPVFGEDGLIWLIWNGGGSSDKASRHQLLGPSHRGENLRFQPLVASGGNNIRDRDRHQNEWFDSGPQKKSLVVFMLPWEYCWCFQGVPLRWNIIWPKWHAWFFFIYFYIYPAWNYHSHLKSDGWKTFFPFPSVHARKISYFLWFTSKTFLDFGCTLWPNYSPCHVIEHPCPTEASHLGMPLDYVLLGGLVCIFNRNNGQNPGDDDAKSAIQPHRCIELYTVEKCYRYWFSLKNCQVDLWTLGKIVNSCKPFLFV